jgi:DNA mismatch repair protein MutH
MTQPPQTIDQLLTRCQSIAGLTIGQLAAMHQQKVPPDLRRDKGWVGQLLEMALGAEAGSQALPDFPKLGVELKSLPINAKGKPLESTYVCVAALTGVAGQQWEDSWVCPKLAKVLWVPVLAQRQIPIAERQLGTPFLWQPDEAQQQMLRQDWEELMELITLGGIDQIKGAHGKALQLRPKAADSRALTAAVGKYGQPISTLPRGFYLKASFTADILARQFNLQ